MSRWDKRHRDRKAKWFLLLMVLLVLTGYGFFFMERVVKPAIASVGEVKAKSMIITAINEVVRIKFMEDVKAADLLDMTTDANGKITMVQADSSAMTELSYDLASRIQNAIRNMREERVMVPLGTILGSQILSQTGPKIKLKVLPLGTSKVAFYTEFEEAGINQTKYKIYLKVESQAKVLVPFSASFIEVENVLLVAETIIIGDVPQTYIRVPEEDMMDAWNNS